MHVELPVVTRPMMRPSSSHAASISASVPSPAVGVDEGAGRRGARASGERAARQQQGDGEGEEATREGHAPILPHGG